MGLKLLLVCALALVMTIPAAFVFFILGDRTHRAEAVSAELSRDVGGEQTFLGPVLAVPYAVPATEPDKAPAQGVYVIFPVEGEGAAILTSEVRRRSLFEVPVYQTDLAFKARFNLSGALDAAPRGAVFDWPRAELLLGAADPRGARADIALTAGGRTLAVAPANLMAETGLSAEDGHGGRLRFFGAPAGEIAQPDARFDAVARLRFTGAERISVLAFAKTTRLEMRGDWPHPSFDGGFLPVRRDIGDKGFTASWSVPFIARGVPAQGLSETVERLGQTALGVSLVEPANPYQSVSRSLKYAPLFLGLVFLAFFLFETAQGRRVHPAQYVLIGLAQIIFYLLLLSIAERIGFDAAFAIAAAATVGLISAYAGWVFESRRQGLIALAAFSVLYGLIYVLMRLEDLALLIGAVTSFAAIAAAMYFTRRIDWYGVAPVETDARSKESP